MTKYGPFYFGQKSASNEELQKRLLEKGYFIPGDVDGIFGRKTAEALARMQGAFGFPASGRVEGGIVQVLFPEGVYTAPVTVKRERRSTLMNSQWLSGIVASTAFKYAVAMAATWLAQKLGMDPVAGKVTIEGVLTQAIGVIAGVWGMWEASKSKIVVDGQRVKMSDLNTADQAKVEAIVEKAKDKV